MTLREFSPRCVEAVREALREHKRAGNPVAVWEEGRVVWVPPEEIPDWPDDPEDA